MISDEAAKLIEAVREYGSAFSTPGAAALGWYLGRRRAEAESSKLENEGDASKLDAITRHMTALIDGYEKRIDDLTREVTALRAEIVELRNALDAQLRGQTIPPSPPLP